jgi:serine phosphatase RsbU (regulator of sigma subunit)
MLAIDNVVKASPALMSETLQDPAEPERMHCMEVWGGNVRVDKHFQMAGLDAWVVSQPEGGAQAGGDVYYISSCSSGRITRILLADVSGHGEIVAQTAAGLRDLMQQNINVVGQRRFVAAMNRQFTATSSASDFATAVVCSFFAPTQVLSICNAGHPNPLLFRASNREWTTLTSENLPKKPAGFFSNLPLGIDGRTGYDQLSTRLDEGDMVLCYTDAFIEAMTGTGQYLGVEGVRQIVASIPFDNERAFTASLYSAVRALHPDNLAGDDATVVLFRANGTRTTVRDDLMAPIRFFCKVSDASRIAEA